jgi:hypothetical protein
VQRPAVTMSHQKSKKKFARHFDIFHINKVPLKSIESVFKKIGKIIADIKFLGVFLPKKFLTLFNEIL